MEDKFKVRMISYNHVRNTANIGFVSKTGKVKSIYIHADTFSRLMDGSLDKDEYNPPSSEQIQLRDIIRAEVKDDFGKWFNESANKLSMEACNG